MRSIELYAGAGGTALGLFNAGFGHSLVVESDKTCVETMKANTNWNIVLGSVKDVDMTIYKDIDLISAGFPCQPFSFAGNRLGVEDYRGHELGILLSSIQQVYPRVVFLENVKGLLNISNGAVFKTLQSTLASIGYKVYYKVLNAADYGVAQKRERLIIIAIRNDIHYKEYEFPEKLHYKVSLRTTLRNVDTSPGAVYSESKKAVLKLVPPGGNWKNLPIEIQKSYMGASFNSTGGRTGMARRLSWEEQCLTLTCSPAQKQTERCHPDETRPLTIREYARIQSFPDEWVFKGSITAQYKQIGNACPVLLSYFIGVSIKEYLDGV